MWNERCLDRWVCFVNRTYYSLANTTFAAFTAMLYVQEMRYSTSDLSRKSGDIIAHAMQAPVTITQRGKPRLVLLSVDEYNRLRKRTNEQTSAIDSEKNLE
jgi:prevent-host-death family protein